MEERKYDEVVIQLRKNDTSVGTIRMGIEQIELLMKNHAQPMGDILELMVQAMESEIKSGEDENRMAHGN